MKKLIGLCVLYFLVFIPAFSQDLEKFEVSSITENSAKYDLKVARLTGCCSKKVQATVKLFAADGTTLLGQSRDMDNTAEACGDSRISVDDATITGLSPNTEYVLSVTWSSSAPGGQLVCPNKGGTETKTFTTTKLPTPTLSVTRTGENTVSAVLKEGSNITDKIDVYINDQFLVTVYGSGTYNLNVPPTDLVFSARLDYTANSTASIPNTTTVSITARNSTNSKSDKAVTPMINLGLNPPINLTHSLLGDKDIMLNWQNQSLISNQVLIRRNNVPIDTVTNAASYMDQNVPPNTALKYDISAYYEFGGQAYESPIATRVLIQPVSNLQVSFRGENFIEFAWKNNSPDADEIRIYRDYSLIATLSNTATSYTDNNVAINTEMV
jgi:hypothetical protein